MWKLQPPWKKLRSSQAPLFENLVGGSTPLQKGVGGVHYDLKSIESGAYSEIKFSIMRVFFPMVASFQNTCGFLLLNIFFSNIDTIIDCNYVVYKFGSLLFPEAVVWSWSVKRSVPHLGKFGDNVFSCGSGLLPSIPAKLYWFILLCSLLAMLLFSCMTCSFEQSTRKLIVYLRNLSENNNSLFRFCVLITFFWAPITFERYHF